jgi:hypothetical protein
VRENYKRYKAKALAEQWKIRILEHIGQTSCIACGNSEWRVLEFKHNRGAVKEFAIKYGFTHCYSLDRLKLEAEKCSVYCANCGHISRLGREGRFQKYAEQALERKQTLLALVGQEQCQDCGMTDARVLSFHHTQNNKLFRLAVKLNQVTIPLDTLLEEALKCQVLCINCHRLHHILEAEHELTNE